MCLVLSPACCRSSFCCQSRASLVLCLKPFWRNVLMFVKYISELKVCVDRIFHDADATVGNNMLAGGNTSHWQLNAGEPRCRQRSRALLKRQSHQCRLQSFHYILYIYCRLLLFKCMYYVRMSDMWYGILIVQNIEMVNIVKRYVKSDLTPPMKCKCLSGEFPLERCILPPLITVWAQQLLKC